MIFIILNKKSGSKDDFTQTYICTSVLYHVIIMQKKEGFY